MARPIPSLVCMVLVACAAGCAGPKLTGHNARRLQLGQTGEPQIRAIFGKPAQTDERSDGSGVSRVVEYRLVEGGIDLIGFRDLEVRFLAADVFNGRLRGWVYVSSDDDAPTRIRRSAVPQIESGRTTRDEVLGLLGEPAGRALPGTRIEDYQGEFGPGVQEIWAWTAVVGAHDWYVKPLVARILLVKFDASGRVVQTVTREMQSPWVERALSASRAA
jgi:outer membrane protein assembly factor BamE (lipoprotein component of BamABCDE complex)